MFTEWRNEAQTLHDHSTYRGLQGKKKKKQEGALKMDPPEAGLKKSANKNLRADKDLTL